MPLADERKQLYPLADIHNLHGLEIVSNEVVHDLSPLVRCRNLRELKVSGYSMLQDLSALASTAVERLTLQTVTKTLGGASIDLGTLAGATIHHLTIQHPDLARGLGSLPDLPLTELRVTNRAERRSLLGIARWSSLTSVAMNGAPTPAELVELRGLLSLRHLVLYGVPEYEADRVRAEILDDVTVKVYPTARTTSGESI